MTTIVLSNGHLRTETIEAAIDALIEVLGDHPLNRLFEKYGEFVERDARNLRGEWLEGVENAVSSVDGVGQVRVDLVFDPPWTPERMSEEAQVAVGWF